MVKSYSTCFPAGSKVLMADKTWRDIETVEKGELVLSINGPTKVEKQYQSFLGPRKMLTFAEDRNCIWSEEHLFWVMYIKEWWWTYNTSVWRKEVETGYTKGLKDNYSLYTGDKGFYFAHLTGWIKRQVVEDFSQDWNPDTPVYLSMTDGSPIIVDGYLVTGGTDESRYDYTKINWDVDYKKF